MSAITRFSITLEAIDLVASPIVMRAIGTCDRCGHEFLVNSPDKAQNLLFALVYHIGRCPK